MTAKVIFSVLIHKLQFPEFVILFQNRLESVGGFNQFSGSVSIQTGKSESNKTVEREKSSVIAPSITAECLHLLERCFESLSL